MRPSHFRAHAIVGLLRVAALVALTFSCNSDHPPTAPRLADELTPSMATAPAVVANPGGPYSGTEGAPIAFDGSGSQGAGLRYDWDFGDGSPHDTTAMPAHAYRDNKTYTVRLFVTDAAGVKSTTAQTSAIVANAAPVVASLAPPSPAPRAKLALTLTASFTDAGVLDRHSGSFVWGDTKTNTASIVDSGGFGTASASHSYAAAGTYNVSVRVVDNNGGADTVKMALVVGPANAAPRAAAGGPYAGVEGSPIAFDGTASSDPEGDAIRYDWDFGDATPHDTAAAPTHTYRDNKAYTVKLVVTDAYGAKSAASQATATVTNAPPAVSSFTGPTSPMPGSALTVSASFTDPGTRDTHTATFDWGDTGTSAGTVTESGGSGKVTGSHTYAANGSYTVTLRLTDNAGAADTATLLLAVGGPASTAPTAVVGGPYSGTEAQPLTFDGSRSSAVIGGPLTYDWNFGDASPHGTGANPTHTYARAGSFVVTLVVTDSAGVASAPATTAATVANVPPSVAIVPSNWSYPGTPYTLQASFSDPGGDGPFAVRVDWGDGSGPTTFTAAAAGNVTLTHTYVGEGSFDLTTSATDAVGGTGSTHLSVLARRPSSQSSVFIGAGDVGDCGTAPASSSHAEMTAEILDTEPGTVFTLGDNTNESGTLSEMLDCFGPTWGRHDARMHPAVGNHEYYLAGAPAYWQYFSANNVAVGDSGKYFYSYDLAPGWHVVVLNSEIAYSAGSEQQQWLLADLAAHPSRCTLAIWHTPKYYASSATGRTSMSAIWTPLYNAGAELVLNGHVHSYQRYAEMSPYGAADPGRGIREIIVGTGGTNIGSTAGVVPNLEVLNGVTYGVLKLWLDTDGYYWKFLPIAGQTFTDAGYTACH